MTAVSRVRSLEVRLPVKDSKQVSSDGGAILSIRNASSLTTCGMASGKAPVLGHVRASCAGRRFDSSAS